jgi:hypothetical protein
MEAILPREMIGEVMQYLSTKDLTLYGQSSKTTLESAETEWRVRYNNIVGEKIEDMGCNTLVYWMKNYSINIRNQFNSNLNMKLELFENENRKEEKRSIICGMLDLVVKEQMLFSKNSHYKSLQQNIEEKLLEFLNGNDFEFKIANKYYPILFPEKYKVAMEKREEEKEENLKKQREWREKVLKLRQNFFK